MDEEKKTKEVMAVIGANWVGRRSSRDEFDEFGIFYTTVKRGKDEKRREEKKERERGWVRRVDWVIHERKRLISECCVYTLLESIAPY